MCPYSLHGVVATFDFGNHSVVIVAVEPSAIANLSAGFRIKRRVIEDDFAFLAGLEFLRALTLADDGEDFAAVGASLAIALEVGFRKLLVSGIGSLLGRAFPGSASASLLLFHRAIKTLLIENNALITCRILHEVERHAKSVVELESLVSGQTSLFRAAAPCTELRRNASSSFLSPISSVCANLCSSDKTVFDDAVGRLLQLGIRVLHQVAHCKDHFV